MEYNYGHGKRKRPEFVSKDWHRPHAKHHLKPKLNSEFKELANHYAHHADFAYIPLKDRRHVLKDNGLNGWLIHGDSTDEISILKKGNTFVVSSTGTRPDGWKEFLATAVSPLLNLIKPRSKDAQNTANDFDSDSSLFLGNIKDTERFNVLDKAIAKLRLENPKATITLAGHSLGGKLAHEVAIKHKLHSYAFNPGSSLNSNTPTPTNVVFAVEGDIISSGWKTPYTFVRKDGGNAHSLDNFFT